MDIIEDKLKSLKTQLLTKLTKTTLENTENNFIVNQKIHGSNIITLNSIPDNNRILEEDISLDFSNFALNWKNVGNIVATSIACSET